MFNAKLQNGTLISLADDKWQLEELKRLREKERFYCPACKGVVHLKLGMNRRWHFAHQNHSTCNTFFERETPYHLQGKKDLYKWLKSKGVEVALEVYLPLIRQRPDLLFRYKNTLYALEYQCAPIEPQLLQKRTSGYEQMDIVPIWILGGNRLKRDASHIFSLKSFEWHTMRQNVSNDYMLMYYCPDEKKVAYLHQLTPFSPTRLLASYEERSLHNLQVHSFLYPSMTHPLSTYNWLMIKKRWRLQRPSRYPSRTERYVQQLLYNARLPLSLFPIEAGWPSKYHYLIASPPYKWQSFLLFASIRHQQLHRPFSSRIIKQCIKPHIQSSLFRSRPIVDHPHWSKAVDGYLHWLCEVNYLKRVDEDVYVRIRNKKIPLTTEEAIRLDRLYYERVAELHA